MKHPRLVGALVAGRRACPRWPPAPTTPPLGNGQRRRPHDQRHLAATTRATCPRTRHRRATSSTRSRTPAARSPSSTSTARTGCASSARSRTSDPGLSRDLVVNVPAGNYVPACKPGMTGKGIRSDFTVTDSGRERARSPAPRSSRSTTANAQYQRLRRGPVRPAARRHEGSSWRRTRPATTPRPAALRAGPRALGAHRAGRGVLRRPRPEDGRPRGRPRAGPEVDRLAPDREGPVAAGGEPTPALTAGRSGRRTPTSCWPTPRRSTRRVAEADLHRRPDRQRRQEPARRGRDRQGHRRGGDLVAHRPLRLPGQRRRRPRRVRGPAAGARAARTRRSRSRSQQRFAALQALLDQLPGRRRGFVTYDKLTDDEVKQLSDAVNALSEPLSRLTAAVTL